MKKILLVLILILMFTGVIVAEDDPYLTYYSTEYIDWIINQNLRINDYFDYFSQRLSGLMLSGRQKLHVVADFDALERGSTTGVLRIPTQWGEAKGVMELLNAGIMIGKQEGNTEWRAFILFNGFFLGSIDNINDLDFSLWDKDEVLEWPIFDLLIGGQYSKNGIKITVADYMRNRVVITNGIYQIDLDTQKGVTKLSHSLYFKFDYKALLARIISQESGLSEAGLSYLLALPGQLLGNLSSGFSYFKSFDTISLDIFHSGIALWNRLFFSYRLRFNLLQNGQFDTGLDYASLDTKILVYSWHIGSITEYSRVRRRFETNSFYGGVFLIGGISRMNNYVDSDLKGFYAGVSYKKIKQRSQAHGADASFIVGKNHYFILSRVPIKDDIFVHFRFGYGF